MKKLRSIFFLILGLLIYQIPSLKAQEKPNIVIFLIDDLGWTDLSGYGSSFYQTPAIDQLAQEGVKFTNGYAACTVCSPTRAALMSGKYPARLHLTDWIAGHPYPYAKWKVPEWTQYLPPEEETLAEVLKKEGYVSAQIGKWHLGEEDRYWPEHQGFDRNVGGYYRGAPHLNKEKDCFGYFSPYCNPRLEDGPKGEYLTDRLTQEAQNFITQNKERPFLLYLSHYAVHTPLQAKKERIKKYERLADTTKAQHNATYAAMLESTDQSVEAVMRTLDSLDLLENTLVFFTGDNGGLLRATDNTPLRAGKGSIYEGGIRVPLVAYWKGKIAGGRVEDTPAITMDIFQSVASLANPQAQATDGINLMPLLLEGKNPATRPLFWHYPHYHRQGAVPYSAVRVGDWKLIELLGEDHFELYNLKEDIGETNNLVDKNPAKFQELRQLLHDWREEIGAQFPSENPDYDPERAEEVGPRVKSE